MVIDRFKDIPVGGLKIDVDAEVCINHNLLSMHALLIVGKSMGTICNRTYLSLSVPLIKVCGSANPPYFLESLESFILLDLGYSFFFFFFIRPIRKFGKKSNQLLGIRISNIFVI